jgi:hypothetical protein
MSDAPQFSALHYSEDHGMARSVSGSDLRTTASLIIEALTDLVGQTDPAVDELDESAWVECASFSTQFARLLAERARLLAKIARLLAERARLLEEYLAPEGIEQLQRNRKGTAPSLLSVAVAATAKPKS